MTGVEADGLEREFKLRSATSQTPKESVDLTTITPQILLY